MRMLPHPHGVLVEFTLGEWRAHQHEGEQRRIRHRARHHPHGRFEPDVDERQAIGNDVGNLLAISAAAHVLGEEYDLAHDFEGAGSQFDFTFRGMRVVAKWASKPWYRLIAHTARNPFNRSTADLAVLVVPFVPQVVRVVGYITVEDFERLRTQRQLDEHVGVDYVIEQAALSDIVRLLPIAVG